MKIKFFLLVLLLLLAGCAPAGPVAPRGINLPDPSRADPHGKLVLSLGGEVSVLNPILSSDSASSAVEGAVFTGMIRFNEKLEPEPDLAKSWEVSKDGRVWTFHLRPGVKWHDGHPFTAEDVKFTFDSILDPTVNSVRRSDYIIDGHPVLFKVINPYTFQAVLPKPFAPFITHVAMSIIPKHLYQGTEVNTAAWNRHPIGTGPFKFKEWQTGDHIALVRNADYYFGAPKLEEIIYKIIPNENSALLALEAGEVDEAGIPAKDYSRMLTMPKINIFEYESLLYTYLGLNLARPYFADQRIRQALAHALDRQQLINLVLKGHGTPAYAPSAPVSWAYSDDVPKFSYDLQRAKRLLKEAGYLNGFEFTCLVNQGNKDREKAAVILQQQFAKIGVKMNVRVMEWSALLKIVNAPKDPKDFDAVIIGWSLGLDPDSYSIWHSSQYPKGFNFIKYQNAEVDRLLEQGRTTINKEERKKIYGRIWKLIAQDQPYVFLWYPKVIGAISDRVGGLRLPPGPAGPLIYIEKVFVAK